LLPIKKNQFLRPSRSIGMRYRAAPLPELSLLPIKKNQFLRPSRFIGMRYRPAPLPVLCFAKLIKLAYFAPLTYYFHFKTINFA